MISRQSFKLKIQTRLLRIHGSQELHAFFTNMLQSQVFLMGKYPLDVFQKKKGEVVRLSTNLNGNL